MIYLSYWRGMWRSEINLYFELDQDHFDTKHVGVFSSSVFGKNKNGGKTFRDDKISFRMHVSSVCRPPICRSADTKQNKQRTKDDTTLLLYTSVLNQRSQQIIKLI